GQFPCRLDGDVDKPRRRELFPVLLLAERSADAGGPRAQALPYRGQEATAHHDVGDREPAAWPEHSPRLAQHAVLIAGEVDDAVGDDDVDAGVGQGNLLDVPLEEARVLDTGLLPVPL